MSFTSFIIFINSLPFFKDANLLPMYLYLYQNYATFFEAGEGKDSEMVQTNRRPVTITIDALKSALNKSVSEIKDLLYSLSNYNYINYKLINNILIYDLRTFDHELTFDFVPIPADSVYKGLDISFIHSALIPTVKLWIDHRYALKKPIKTQTQLIQQLNKLIKLCCDYDSTISPLIVKNGFIPALEPDQMNKIRDAAKYIVENAVSNGWQGLYLPRSYNVSYNVPNGVSDPLNVSYNVPRRVSDEVSLVHSILKDNGIDMKITDTFTTNVMNFVERVEIPRRYYTECLNINTGVYSKLPDTTKYIQTYIKYIKSQKWIENYSAYLFDWGGKVHTDFFAKEYVQMFGGDWRNLYYTKDELNTMIEFTKNMG